MKTTLIILFVLTITASADASLLISMDGVVDPPDTQIVVVPSDVLSLGMWGDGTNPGNDAFWITVDGPCYAMDPPVNPLDIIYYPGDLSWISVYRKGDSTQVIEDFINPMPGLENVHSAYYIEFATSSPTVPPLSGMLVDDLGLHIEDWGDIILVLHNIDLTAALDMQVIHALPEPTSLALLALGGLLLRRRGKDNEKHIDSYSSAGNCSHG